jgi:hypothetical protein
MVLRQERGAIAQIRPKSGLAVGENTLKGWRREWESVAQLSKTPINMGVFTGKLATTAI